MLRRRHGSDPPRRVWPPPQPAGPAATSQIGETAAPARRRRHGHDGAVTAVAPPSPASLPDARGRSHTAAARTSQRISGLLAVSAVALVLTHWLRLLPLGYPAPGATRWEDFVDLLTPYVVAGPMLVVLVRVGASRRAWTAALAGCALFVQGHGVHLSANSISYAQGDAAPTYLWDEVIGHVLWFIGLTVLVVAVAHSVRAAPLNAGGLSCGLAVLVGATWAANVVEAGQAGLGAVLAGCLVGYGWCTRDGAPGRLLLLAFVLSLVLVSAWGFWQGGFPQPSELGWL